MFSVFDRTYFFHIFATFPSQIPIILQSIETKKKANQKPEADSGTAFKIQTTERKY